MPLKGYTCILSAMTNVVRGGGDLVELQEGSNGGYVAKKRDEIGAGRFEEAWETLQTKSNSKNFEKLWEHLNEEGVTAEFLPMLDNQQHEEIASRLKSVPKKIYLSKSCSS